MRRDAQDAPIATIASEDKSATLAKTKRKTILTLASRGGYGHTAAYNTLAGELGDSHQLQSLCPIEHLSFLGIPFREELYNLCLRRGWMRPVNFITGYVAPVMFKSLRQKTEELIGRYLDEVKPDILISVIPLINFPASEAARKRNIPFLIVTTDNDLINWSMDLHRIIHPEFQITIGTDLPSTRGLLERCGVPKHRIRTIGLPLRPDFLIPRDKQALRQSFEVPSGKPVLTVMMGGAGSRIAVQYTERIAALGFDAHLMVCTGKNGALGEEIRSIKAPQQVTIEVVGFTDEIAELMALSDLLITKPGPGTINEAIALKVPMLLDNTGGHLYWELANLELARQYGVAMVANRLSDLDGLVSDFLQNPATRRRLKEPFGSIPANRFHQRIRQIIDSF